MTTSRWLTAMVALTGAISACSTPAAPSALDAAAPRFADLKAMAGAYTLTIGLDATCNNLPALARQRTYRAVLEDRGWHFLVVAIDGGGFSEPTQIGDLFSGEFSPGAEPTLKWNSTDVGCDVGEPLAGVGALAVCGFGPVTRTATGLTATVTGNAAVLRPGVVGPWCSGVHQFSFERDR